MQELTISSSVGSLEESFSFNKVAKLASGSVLYRQKNCCIIATVAMQKSVSKEEFLPLTVQYLERSYAASKIPGGFIKRESKPSDFEILTSRVVDRAIRPLFPKEYRYPTTVTLLVVSSDSGVDLQVAAMHAASAALLNSSLPIKKRPIAAVRVGIIDDQPRYNPTLQEQEASSLDLLVAGDIDGILMIEMSTKATQKFDDTMEVSSVAMLDPVVAPSAFISATQSANELKEDELIELLEQAQNRTKDASLEYAKLFEKVTNIAHLVEPFEDADIKELEQILHDAYKDELKSALNIAKKQSRSEKFDEIYKDACKNILKQKGEKFSSEDIYLQLHALKGKLMRKKILEQGVRVDSRGVDDVRQINIETNTLPSVHGSALFTRGETQVLAALTLGDDKDAQLFERLTDNRPQSERFMLHYNFPAFSVGEAKPIGAPSRRELGHGNLAKKALLSVVDMEHDGTIRIVAEVLQSNGSSSMASVCAGSLALECAKIKCTDLVAGVAMGLVKKGEEYAILTDIMGVEDYFGDMDFKVAGTKNGITAMQMDAKPGGISLQILKESLKKANIALGGILEKMDDAKSQIKRSQALPITELFHIDPSRIGEIIGKAGSTIREIIERFEVSIDLDKKVGKVKVSGSHDNKVQAAKDHIKKIASTPKPQPVTYEKGKIYSGVVKKVVDFGVFVQMPDGFDALLHISKISKDRIENLRELYSEGDEVEVVVLEQNGDKVELATTEFLS